MRLYLLRFLLPPAHSHPPIPHHTYPPFLLLAVAGDDEIVQSIQQELQHIGESLDELVLLVNPETTTTDLPSSTVSSDEPASPGSSSTTSASSGASVQSSTTDAPVETTKTQAPVETTETQAPVETTETQAPVETTKTQAPVETTETQAPSFDETKASSSEPSQPSSSEEPQTSTSEPSQSSSSEQPQTSSSAPTTTIPPTPVCITNETSSGNDADLCERLTSVLEDIEAVTSTVAKGTMGQAELDDLRNCSTRLDDVIEDMRNNTDFLASSVDVEELIARKDALDEVRKSEEDGDNVQDFFLLITTTTSPSPFLPTPSLSDHQPNTITATTTSPFLSSSPFPLPRYPSNHDPHYHIPPPLLRYHVLSLLTSAYYLFLSFPSLPPSPPLPSTTTTLPSLLLSLSLPLPSSLLSLSTTTTSPFLSSSPFPLPRPLPSSPPLPFRYHDLSLPLLLSLSIATSHPSLLPLLKVLTEAEKAVEDALSTDDYDPTLAIVLGVLGGLLGVGIIGYVGFTFYKKNKAKKARKNDNPMTSMERGSGQDNSAYAGSSNRII
ncbi:putative mucin-5AC [Penaeus vannamei]|uniref:Putative mucin-5AC n=1 Tax=Penaeus vannamei TaxID=6689 RepID=A0A423TI79_PENVA|nr:putative mucin-5AC [Penaeus vannamei]